MRTIESLNSASSRAGVSVFSVAHERVSHDHQHEHEHDHHTTTRIQPTRKGLALCHITLDVAAPPVGPGKDTQGTRRPLRGKAVGGPTTSHDTRRPPDNDKP